MKVIVPIKRVVDYNVKVRPLNDESGVDLNNVKMSINPFCEIAVEEAVRLKEAGADRAVLLETNDDVEPLGIAKLLAKLCEEEKPDLIILGKQAIDGDNNQTGQILAALLGFPQATFASELKINDGVATVTREIDGGLQTIAVNLPAIVTTDLRLNEPRYASLPNIMKAKKKELNVIDASSLGIDFVSRLTTLKVELPPSRDAGVKVESVEELVDKLKNEAKVI